MPTWLEIPHFLVQSALLLGLKCQFDKWFLFHAPTPFLPPTYALPLHTWNGYHLSFWRFFPWFTVSFALKLAIFPLKRGVLGARKGQMVNSGFQDPKTPEIPLKQRENVTTPQLASLHGLPRNWAKSAIKLGKKRPKGQMVPILPPHIYSPSTKILKISAFFLNFLKVPLSLDPAEPWSSFPCVFGFLACVLATFHCFFARVSFFSRKIEGSAKRGEKKTPCLFGGFLAFFAQKCKVWRVREEQRAPSYKQHPSHPLCPALSTTSRSGQELRGQKRHVITHKVSVGQASQQIERGGKDPHPQDFSLTKTTARLLKANFVLTKDRKRPYYRHFCGKMHREGSCSKAAGDSVNIWCIVFFPVLKPLACGRQSRCLGWTYKLPGGQKFSIKLSALSVGFPQRRPLNLIKDPSL